VVVHIKTSFIKLVGVFFILSLMSCSDGGGEGDIVTPDHPTGSFLNGKVTGLEYNSHTWRDGVTDEKGEFIYAPGESISFSVGNIDLGSTQGKANITPADLAPRKSDGSLSPEAVNMTRFLMSIDHDGNVNNGILITPETSEALLDASLDFGSPEFDVEAQAIIESLDDNPDEIFPEGDEPRGLVSEVEAAVFLEETIAEIEDEEAAAEAEAAQFGCGILRPNWNAVLVQGQSIPVQGFVKGGSGQYTYEWTLDGQVTSTALNPGISTSTLTPGTYTLQFKVKDSDGVQGSDQRLVTVLDKAATYDGCRNGILSHTYRQHYHQGK